MCEYCGCREVQPIAELMDEHAARVDQAHHVRQALGSGDHVTALARLTGLVTHLEHRGFGATVAGLDVDEAHTRLSSFRLDPTERT